MKRIILSMLLLLLVNIGWSQNKVFVATDSIKGAFSHFSVDNFGRVYLCKNDVVLQYYKDNDSIYTASLKSFRPTSIESSKSFRILLFDQERSVVRFFDNTLTDINGEIDLVSLDIQQPLLVCESFAGNSFWVLDGGMMRLVKLNKQLEIISQTENLVSLFDNEELPIQMIEQNDFLYILVPGKGVAIFDVFGTFIKIYETQASHIGVLNNYLLLQTNNVIQAVSNKAFFEPEFSYTIPKGVKYFVFSNQQVYFLKDKALLIGKFQTKK